MKKVFIDGSEGTTGLKLASRLAERKDIELLKISSELRKDTAARSELMNAADFVFLCLPDKAAIEAVSLIKNENTRILDASTAHRTNKDWAYGFPELSKSYREKIKTASRLAVPGCYAGGMLALIYPLLEAGALPSDFPACFSAVSGYSGGGKAMIEEYEATAGETPSLSSLRQYGLSQEHKHLAEVTAVAGLALKPLFCPSVTNYPCGMIVNLPIHSVSLKGEWAKKGAKGIHELMQEHYKGQKLVKVMKLYGEDTLENGIMFSDTLAGRDDMQIFVFGNEERILLSARFDNLGKGASGAAVQCMNIMMDLDETTGLILK